jgi:hypothetical protein
VEKLENDLWEYHWCLKSTAWTAGDIYFVWPDLGVSGLGTGCGGFWGISRQSRSEPIDLVSTATVGPNLTEIHPAIQFPASEVQTPIWQKFLNYVTSVFASLSLDKAGDQTITIGLTIKSSATPIIEDGQHEATQYEIEYSDPLSNGISPVRFFFDDAVRERVKELDRDFAFSDESRRVEFIQSGPPANLVGTLIFVGPDNYEIGTMPVSLALPKD